jgi:DNA adenine methylase
VVLSDVNGDLINTYIQVKRRPLELIACLRQLPVNEATYRSLRSDDPKRNIDRAVRFLYLNRTAFGGIYRLNRNGDFNVPFGGGARTPAPLWEENLLISASRRLRNASLICGDFEDMLAEARAGDLVYCDPTYTVTHDNNGFVRYNERNFCWDDQKRLAATCQQVAKRGATVLVSNADHEKVLELYPSCEVRQFDRMSLLCPDSQKRRPTKELLFVIRPGKSR